MSPSSWTASPSWMAAGWTMLHLAWVGTTVGLAAALARLLLKEARPETRYGVALALLLGLGATPAAIFAGLYEPDARPPRSRGLSEGLAGRPSPTGTRAEDFARREATEPLAPTPGRPAGEPPRSRLAPLVALLPWLWMGGSLLTLLLLGTGLVGVERLRRSSAILTAGAIPDRCRALADSLGIAGRVAVGMCDRLASPVLVGIVRPLILLPPAALGGWSVEQVEMVLLHELAHLKRRDNLANLAQRVVEALLFFHPATWWLSRWVRLERESCCDRLVVDRVREPRAYAEMLLDLAGPGRERRVATAMAEGQVMTRIRRILNLEDRSMKLSMPEGVGVLAASAVLAALALGSRAAETPAAPGDAKLALLRKAVESIETPRDSPPDRESEGESLISIARVQLKLGDREAGLATLVKAFSILDKGEFASTEEDMDRLSSLTLIPTLQREAGDLAGARASLDRLTEMIAARKVDPAKASKIAPVEGDAAGTMRVDEPSDSAIRAECLAELSKERLGLGDRDEARRLALLAIDAVGAEPAGLRGLIYCYLGGTLRKAGDPAAAREWIARARKLAEEAATPEEREAILGHVAWGMAEAGDLDEALAIALNLGARRPKALAAILETMTERREGLIWYDAGGIKIAIGADLYTVPDPASSRRDLPKVADAVRRAGGPLVLARTLATVAHLQAKAGDIDGAWTTAESIPAIRRKDFPGPSDGFYDAVRPSTFALIAREQSEGGVGGARDAARGKFRAALDLARAVEDEGERIVASLVIAREQARVGDRAAALALLREVLPLALSRPEPRRSRSLVMIADVQVGAGDLAAAARTAEAIRPYPKQEKLRALQGLADAHDKAGDAETAKAFVRRALDIFEAKPPADAKLGPSGGPSSIGADTFIDPDLELRPRRAEFDMQGMSVTLRARLNGADDALRTIREMPADPPIAARRGVLTPRQLAYGALVSSLAHRGDLAGAEAVVATIESPEARRWALIQMAYAIGGPEQP